MFSERKKLLMQTTITAVALVLVLVYNFVHTGGLLASYVEPWWIGYVAALGIELAVVGLSLQIGYRRRINDTTGFFYFVLISVVIVSALANMSQGHLQRYTTELTWANLTSIDVIQGIVGIAATALLSLIVMAMAEIVGQFMEREQDTNVDTSSQVPMFHSATEAVRWWHEQQPELTPVQLAEQANCSRSTVSRALDGDGNHDHR